MEQFEEVDWEHLDLSLKSKANNYKIWQSKQASGFCGTRVQVGLYSGEPYLNERCPNCKARETDTHLMHCPNKDRTRLLIKNVDELEKMDGNGRTYGPRTDLLDTKVHFNEKQQTIFPHGTHVSKDASTCRKSRQDRMEKFHGRLHIVPLL